jgi:hypothetical protein
MEKGLPNQKSKVSTRSVNPKAYGNTCCEALSPSFSKTARLMGLAAMLLVGSE